MRTRGIPTVDRGGGPQLEAGTDEPVVAAMAGLILFYGIGFAVYDLPGPSRAAILVGLALALLGMFAGLHDEVAG